MNGDGSSSKTFEEIFDEKFGPDKIWKGGSLFYRCPHCRRRGLSCCPFRGLYFCFHCSVVSGRVEGPNSEPPRRPVFDTTLQKRILSTLLEISGLSDRHREYLRSRGIYRPEDYGFRTMSLNLYSKLLEHYTADELVASGLYRSTGQPDSALSYGRLFFPFWEDGRLVGGRSREDPATSMESRLPRYLTTRGFPSTRHIWHMPKNSSDLVVVEGEIGAAVLHSHGWWTAGLPGLISARINKKKISVLSSRAERVFLVLDSDPGFRESKGILYALRNLVYATSSRCTYLFLPQTCPEEKTDADGFVCSHGPEAFSWLLEDAWHRRKEKLSTFLEENIII